MMAKWYFSVLVALILVNTMNGNEIGNRRIKLLQRKVTQIEKSLKRIEQRKLGCNNRTLYSVFEGVDDVSDMLQHVYTGPLYTRMDLSSGYRNDDIVLMTLPDAMEKCVNSYKGTLVETYRAEITCLQQRMPVCRWCGAFIDNDIYFKEHEDLHRMLDGLGGHMTISRPCKYCGAFYKNPQELNEHEELHRQTDFLNGNSVEDEAKTPPKFQCEICQKAYHYKHHLNTHIRASHSGKKHPCSICSKQFSYASAKKRHEKNCFGTDHHCPKCNKQCASAYGLRRHLAWHDKRHNQSVQRKEVCTTPSTKTRSTSPKLSQSTCNYRCRRCTRVFLNRHDLYLHGMREHYQSGGALQARPWNDIDAPWFRQGEDEGLREVYEANAALILEPHSHAAMRSIYNFPLDNDVTLVQLMDFASDIYAREQRAFRLNVVFGTILQHRETGQYRYFVPYNNNGIFERPVYISRRADLNRLRLRLRRMDIMGELLRQRPDTKWIPVLVTNVHFIVYSTNYPIGQGCLPAYLLRKDSIFPLVKNQQTGQEYKDNLCAFRCLALHRGYNIKSMEGPAKKFYKQWINRHTTAFEGLMFEDFPIFENFFKVNLEVYNLEEGGFARSVYKSRGKQETTMYVNLYENHFSYIRNFALYAKKYQCKTCDRHFTRANNLYKHQSTCSNKTRFVYPGGFYWPVESIFERLEQYDIHVAEEERIFPWFICYDFEAMLQTVNDHPTAMLEWTHRHVPISVSICSNVEGYTEPVCIVEHTQDKLVGSMVETMRDIADTVFELANDKWGWILEAIDEQLRQQEYDEEEMNEDNFQDGGDTVEDEAAFCGYNSHPLKKLYGQFEGYMSQVPVLGFNSAKYDLNLIKRSIARHLNMHDADQKGTFVVKKNNSYACIASDQLKFLDMSQFLAAGSSYAGFLKAYGVEEAKGYFCYEWFNSVEKLNYTTLPKHEDFYSSLKGCNISEEEYLYCQKIWVENKMSSFRDFLVWYNNLDVGPFVTAVERFQAFYFRKGVDVFKTGISVPGIARQLLFKSARKERVNFALFDQNNDDLYQTIKQNIIGGPSIIFNRHHCAGKTFIRSGKQCGSILGFDANALYLQAIGQPMPVGPFIRRIADNNFRPEIRDRYMAAYHWMDWLMHNNHISIQHKLNSGREIRIGKYPVDGYVPASSFREKATVFQFHGCYWHGHECSITKNIKDEKWKSKRAQKYKKTLQITAFLKRDNQVIEMWECQFRKYCQQNPAIYDFINSTRPGFFQRHKGEITENTILKGVFEGELFGMVEVDIHVPKQWPFYFQHPNLSPYQYFQEMSPLFCTTDIPFDAIGPHMQRHVETNGLAKISRRLLVGGMKGKNMLLATPLLRWYLEHGMLVTKVYQVVEFQGQRCFQDFVQEVSDARRQGDTNPDTAIIADSMKVIGNSAYGSLIMDKSKHRNIQYVQGENETSLKVNDPLFRNLDCLDQEEQYYELEMAKHKIKLDLPIQLGYFILQYAKLRMLEFYYDFMDKYVDRADFEYCEMDTDSAYMAISGTCLEEVIKPEMKVKYLQSLNGFCSDTNIEADAEYHWFPRTCCAKHTKYDKRTPGLFKLEYQGHEMIGLCSKTYIVRKTTLVQLSSTRVAAQQVLNRAKGWKQRRRTSLKSRRVDEYKFSSKGVSKRHHMAPMTKFRRVLKTHMAQSGHNRGFRVRNNTIYTYTQERRGFSYFYCKRKVLDDGIHTEPLDITLCPVSTSEVNDQDLIDMLSNNFD